MRREYQKDNGKKTTEGNKNENKKQARQIETERDRQANRQAKTN